MQFSARALSSGERLKPRDLIPLRQTAPSVVNSDRTRLCRLRLTRLCASAQEPYTCFMRASFAHRSRWGVASRAISMKVGLAAVLHQQVALAHELWNTLCGRLRSSLRLASLSIELGTHALLCDRSQVIWPSCMRFRCTGLGLAPAMIRRCSMSLASPGGRVALRRLDRYVAYLVAVMACA